MGQAPSTVAQIALLVLFVLPGITYQFLRERWRGPMPGERGLGERMLRAVAASVLLDALYLVVAGPQLVRLAGGVTSAPWDRPRVVGLVALVLFILVPAVAAAAVSRVQRRRLQATYQAGTPTAWDHAFRDRPPCFIRARLKDGSWAGGWYGPRSYASAYPQPAELFLQSTWQLNPDGSFGPKVNRTAGLHLRASDIDVLEFQRQRRRARAGAHRRRRHVDTHLR